MDYPVLEPREVFRFFAEISRIPRESGNEKAISDYLVQFATDRGLRVDRDEENNVYIYKSGTPGYEHHTPLILQGHMDMVCVKGPTSNHDFRKDPIQWEVRGEMLYAKDTTLGGDDGIAVAYALAILDSQDIPHPPLEVLITTSEETGMFGAAAVHAEKLTGRTLLNIDAEEQGVFFTSCAGGANLKITRICNCEPAQGVAREILISGLRSGHSGLEIDKQRANAIQLLARLLYRMQQVEPLALVTIQGGTKHNAVAAESRAVVVFPDEVKAEKAMEAANKLVQAIQVEYALVDPELTVKIHSTPLPEEQFAQADTEGLVHLLFQLPHGVQSMEPAIPGLVRTSLNLGVLTEMAGIVELVISVRSSLASEKELLIEQIRERVRTYGASIEVNSDYPAWEYAAHSPIRDLAHATYHALTGDEAKDSAIHAGLECGLLGHILPGVDMLSLGPDLYDVHTANEHMRIESVAFTWAFLKKLLADYPRSSVAETVG